MGHLPSSWVETSLGEIRVNHAQRSIPASEPDLLFELYSVPSFETSHPELVYGREIGSDKQTVAPGTVLVCKINPRINRVWVVREESGSPQIASTEWISFFPVKGIDSKYLAYYLQRHDFRDYLASNVSGVGGSLMRVRPAVLDGCNFPLAPLSEQKRIVAAIEEQLTSLNAAVATLKRVQSNLKRYRAAVLKAACEGKLVQTEAELARVQGREYEPGAVLLKRILKEGNSDVKHSDAPLELELPDGWTPAVLGNFGKVGTGATPLRSDQAYYNNGNIPWVTSGALNEPFVRKSIQLVTTEALRRCNLTLYPPHTLLVAMYGEGKTRGKCSELLIEATTNQAIAAVVTEGTGAACRPYLKLVLERYYSEIRGKSSGGVQPNLNLGLVRQIRVPLPPLAEQERIIAEVERRLTVAAGIESVVKADLRRSERLRQSILKRAFEGKLVPQDPNDEPASTLLERIRAERTAAAPERKAHRGRKMKEPAVTSSPDLFGTE